MTLILLAYGVAAYVAVPLGLHGSMQCARACAPKMGKYVTDLTTENWDELSSFEGLAVVKFWAPWCRTCKAIGPRYEQMAFQQQDEPQVRFYQVNFKEDGALCLSQRVMCLPTVHFYVSGIGRVSRCVVDVRTMQPKIAHELTRFLDGGQLATLQKLQRGGREAVVRYTDVMGVLTALAAGRAVPSDDDDKVSAARFRALASDDAYMRDLERLFNWLDRYATEARTQTLRIA